MIQLIRIQTRKYIHTYIFLFFCLVIVFVIFFCIFYRKFACNDAASFCGLKEQLYPDKRGMGFPFDRVYRANTLNDFVNLADNMQVNSFTIRHNNRYIQSKK